MTKPKPCPKKPLLGRTMHRDEPHAVQFTMFSADVRTIYGHIKLDPKGPVELKGPAALYPSMIHVNPKYRKCGIGTKLYEAAAAYACEVNRQLHSDESRSAAAQGFWAKQESKGRAYCASLDVDRNPRDPETEARGRGGCQYYVLTAPCPKPSLNARRQRGGRLRRWLGRASGR